MFERYTELARRSIFFARYEASTFGCLYIETEHLLLGLLREDKSIGGRPWPSSEIEALRKEIEALPRVREKVLTSVDLPLSSETKRALEYAAEEFVALQHKFLDCAHLVLGLLRVENCLAAKMLRKHGVDYATYRESIRLSPPKPPVIGSINLPRPAVRPTVASAPSLQESTALLEELVTGSIDHLRVFLDSSASQKLKRKPWTRKQALGHLIDLATTHHNWLARAMTEPSIVTSGYPGAEWVSAQQYDNLSWADLVRVWDDLNHLLIHVLALIPEDKANTSCRIGVQPLIPLVQVVERYVAVCEDILGQLLGRL